MGSTIILYRSLKREKLLKPSYYWGLFLLGWGHKRGYSNREE